MAVCQLRDSAFSELFKVVDAKVPVGLWNGRSFTLFCGMQLFNKSLFCLLYSSSACRDVETVHAATYFIVDGFSARSFANVCAYSVSSEKFSEFLWHFQNLLI